tara:strand:- start:347 stop:1159 length:813 start_codon:yes stop_codon:yes gene_type:complete
MVDLIAEIGWNHMGDLELAEKMIISAKASGASHAKFQTWHEKNLKQGPWDDDGRKEIYKKAELSLSDFKILKKICEANGIKFLTSVFTISDVEEMSKINNHEIKIPSHEIYNVPLIEKCCQYFQTLFVSTGASTKKELEKIIEVLKLSKREFILMHCVSSYPCSDKNVNLPRIQHLKKYHNRVGFSDHTEDIQASLFSLSYGIEVIEKHFTIDNNLPGRDNKFAILPEDLKILASNIDRFKRMRIDHGIDYQDCESETVNVYRGRWSKNL